MNQSLNQHASQILNAVHAGLKSPNNFSISVEQIKDEIAQARNRHAEQMIRERIFDPEPFRQTIPKLRIERRDFSGVTGYNTNRMEFFASIPELLFLPGQKPVHYITAMDRAYQFKVLYGEEFLFAKHDQYSGKKPTIWIRDTELWLFNPPIANIQFIGVRAMFENPRALNGVGGIVFTDDSPYPMPTSLSDRIRNKLVDDYIRHYRMGNMQPTLMGGDINIRTEK
jgi:hypothetical protein